MSMMWMHHLLQDCLVMRCIVEITVGYIAVELVDSAGWGRKK